MRAGVPIAPRIPWRLASLALLAAVLGTLGGCDRLREDRARAEAHRRAQTAIAAYSEASREANGLHRGIVQAFERANASASLEDYREALTKEVLPAMERFQARLEAMPTGTPELKAVHLELVGAYKEATAELRGFVRDLRKPEDLPKFNPIRDRLQQRVALYSRDLQAYYRRHRRELRMEAGPPGAPAASTATEAP